MSLLDFAVNIDAAPANSSTNNNHPEMFFNGMIGYLEKKDIYLGDQN